MLVNKKVMHIWLFVSVTKQIGLKSTASEWYEESYNRAAFSSVDKPAC